VNNQWVQQPANAGQDCTSNGQPGKCVIEGTGSCNTSVTTSIKFENIQKCNGTTNDQGPALLTPDFQNPTGTHVSSVDLGNGTFGLLNQQCPVKVTLQSPWAFTGTINTSEMVQQCPTTVSVQLPCVLKPSSHGGGIIALAVFLALAMAWQLYKSRRATR
jgi:hypothetical protein